MTEKEMYNLINNQNEQQSNGFAINEKERGLSGVFSALMRKVYTWRPWLSLLRVLQHTA